METFTLTFGDQAENHRGMEVIGSLAEKGFTLEDLLKAKEFFEKNGREVEIYHLNLLLPDDVDVNDAYVLVARKGVDALLGEGGIKKLYKEQRKLEKDKKAYMYGRVVDKKARYNLCFDEESREPNYEDGKGRIIGYEEVPHTFKLKNNLKKMIDKEKVSDLVIEGNYYYDIEKCYIGFHGDSERRRVIGVRMGKDFKLHYQWYGMPELDKEATKKAKEKNTKARDRKVKKMIGKRLEIVLENGDLYIMSEKAVGTDWMSKNVHTLRHAAGECKNLKGINKEFTRGKECLLKKCLLGDIKSSNFCILEDFVSDFSENFSVYLGKELGIKDVKKIEKIRSCIKKFYE